jgi:hypothetical protein
MQIKMRLSEGPHVAEPLIFLTQPGDIALRRLDVFGVPYS